MVGCTCRQVQPEGVHHDGSTPGGPVQIGGRIQNLAKVSLLFIYMWAAFQTLLVCLSVCPSLCLSALLLLPSCFCLSGILAWTNLWRTFFQCVCVCDKVLSQNVSHIFTIL